MNRTLSNVFIFTVGAAIGSAVSYKILKTKFEKIAQEEIESVKQTFSKRTVDLEEAHNRDMNRVYRDILDKTNEKILQENGYTNYSGISKDVENLDEPYVIPPDEFGDFDEYEQVTLYYYADGVLTDDVDEPVDDVEGTVGSNALDSFGEWEDDAVHVRNDKLQCDFEILRKCDNFADICKET